jgi:hypothetical protein
MTTKALLPALLAAGLLVTLPGCSKDDDEPEFRQLEGTAEKLNLDTGQVALRFFHQKSGTEQVIEGIVNDQTEVLINGRVAKLKDIRLKERVKVTGYRKGKGADAQMVAVKVEIERPEWIATGGEEQGSSGPQEDAGAGVQPDAGSD